MKEFKNLNILVCELKVYTDTIKMLHRNIYGENFLQIHEFLREIYEYLDNMNDEVIEMNIPLGFKEPSIKEAVSRMLVYGTRDYECEEAVILTECLLNRIIVSLIDSKDDMPDFIISKFEEYEYDLNVFTYKLGRIML